jgi:hypothetical protein
MAKAFVSIQLDKMRNLRFGMKALSKIEDALGKPLSKVDMNNMTMHELATFIWAGLEHEDKTLDTNGVMELIDDHSDIQTVATILGKAIKEGIGTGAPQGKIPGKK